MDKSNVSSSTITTITSKSTNRTSPTLDSIRTVSATIPSNLSIGEGFTTMNIGYAANNQTSMTFNPVMQTTTINNTNSLVNATNGNILPNGIVHKEPKSLPNPPVTRKVDLHRHPSVENSEAFLACKGGDLAKLKTTINSANVNLRDTLALTTPLHFAAGFGRVDEVEYLLSLGADLHVRDEGGLGEF